jgi:hypothetical protein
MNDPTHESPCRLEFPIPLRPHFKRQVSAASSLQGLMSLHLDVCFLNDLRPLRDFALNKFLQSAR